MSEQFSIGVEEEYQIVDAKGALMPGGKKVVHQAQGEVGNQAQHELFLSQIEIGTPVCENLSQARDEIKRLRRAVIDAAAASDARIVAASTHPFAVPGEQPITPKVRYVEMAEDYQQLARDFFICGCHVHVGIGDRELAIGIMNRARGWLSPLVALAANSPFWRGGDSGYASFRTEVWRRWPMAGSPQVFKNRAEYDALVRTLVETGSISDETKIYWDIRPADRFETIEFRACDVCVSLDDAVAIAGLCRAIARQCAMDIENDERRGAVFVPVRPELLRAAEWRSARYGLEETLIDVHAGATIPAHELISRLLETVRPALEANGDWDEVSALTQQILDRGNGARRQREAYAKRNSWDDVMQFLADETGNGTRINTD